jgi:molecular chaperone GrpE
VNESNGTNFGNTNDENAGQKSTESPKPESSANDLSRRIQELEAQLKEKDGKYLYLYAEFENFKKRTIKERSDLIKFGWESVARDLLQTVDNLERALSHIPPNTDKVLVEGLNMVLNQFKASMQKQGVQHIESLTKDFDPNLHEAVGQEASELPTGMIVKEHARGYTLHGRLLRPAQVIVSGGQTKSEEAKSG